MTSRTIGIIGLGIMGGAISANLVKAGFSVIGHDIDPDRRREAEAAGARLAPDAVGSILELVARRFGSHVVGLGAGTTAPVVIPWGEMGVAVPVEADRVLEQEDKERRDAARKTFEAFMRERNVPIGAAQPSAQSVTAEWREEQGQPRRSAHDEQEGAVEDREDPDDRARPQRQRGPARALVVEAARPVLAAYAKRVVHVGKSGAGQTAKMANQMCIAGAIAGLSEAIRFAQAARLDLDFIDAVLEASERRHPPGAEISERLDGLKHFIGRDRMEELRLARTPGSLRETLVGHASSLPSPSPSPSPSPPWPCFSRSSC